MVILGKQDGKGVGEPYKDGLQIQAPGGLGLDIHIC